MLRSGPDSLHVTDGEEVPLDTWATSTAAQHFDSVEIAGEDAAETELTLPFHGSRLQGDALRERLDAWVSGGVLLSHEVSLAVPSALKGLASGFGMGPGVSPSL